MTFNAYIYPYRRPILKRFISSDGKWDITDSGAYKIGDSIKFELHIPRASAARFVKMHIKSEAGVHLHEYDMTWQRLYLDCDVFSLTLQMNSVAGDDAVKTGLFFFYFMFDSRMGVQRVTQSQADGLPELSPQDCDDGAFALTIYDRKYKTPDDWYGGIIYHIFVDRFAKSGKCTPKPYAKMNGDWYNGTPQFADYPGAPVPNDMFFGGDLYGITEKLPYLKSLNVTCIYLSPVFEAHSNHKYDTGDFETVDSMFGGEVALRTLIKAAAASGISVILDGVFNHTGSDSKYFNMDGSYGESGAYRDKKSEFYKWFSFSDYPDKYDCWWGVKILPRVNSSDSDYIDYISGPNGIIDKYMQMGVAGWRLDVVDELSDVFVDALRRRVGAASDSSLIKPPVSAPVVIGEVWEDASCKIAYGARRRYFTGEQLDSVMNYPVRAALIDYMRYGDEKNLYLALATIWEHYPPEIIHALMNLLGTHDTERIITALAGDSPDGKTNAQLAVAHMTKEQYIKGERLEMLAYLINATIPGIPSIYYGDEAGMEGYTDPFNRLPYPWGKENLVLQDFYMRCNTVRRENDIYKVGGLRLCRHGIDGFFMFGRDGGETVLYTAVNRGETDILLTFSGDFEVLLSVGNISSADESHELHIPPLCGAIIRSNINDDINMEATCTYNDI